MRDRSDDPSPHKHLAQFYLKMYWTKLYGVRSIVKLMRKETCCNNLMDYSFQLVAMDLLYAMFHRWYEIYHGQCYISCGALAGTKKSLKGTTKMDCFNDTLYHDRILYHWTMSRSLNEQRSAYEISKLRHFHRILSTPSPPSNKFIKKKKKKKKK